MGCREPASHLTSNSTSQRQRDEGQLSPESEPPDRASGDLALRRPRLAEAACAFAVSGLGGRGGCTQNALADLAEANAGQACTPPRPALSCVMANSGARRWDIGDWLRGLSRSSMRLASPKRGQREGPGEADAGGFEGIRRWPYGHRRSNPRCHRGAAHSADAKALPPEAPPTVLARSRHRRASPSHGDVLGPCGLNCNSWLAWTRGPA